MPTSTYTETLWNADVHGPPPNSSKGLQLRILLVIETTLSPPKGTAFADNLDSHRLSLIACTLKEL